MAKNLSDADEEIIKAAYDLFDAVKKLSVGESDASRLEKATMQLAMTIVLAWTGIPWSEREVIRGADRMRVRFTERDKSDLYAEACALIAASAVRALPNPFKHILFSTTGLDFRKAPDDKVAELLASYSPTRKKGKRTAPAILAELNQLVIPRPLQGATTEAIGEALRRRKRAP